MHIQDINESKLFKTVGFLKLILDYLINTLYKTVENNI